MDLVKRLEVLAGRLMATTEHHQYAQLVLEAAAALRPEAAHTEWLEDELMEVMRIVAPGMVGKQPDEITYAILVTAIRRLMEADTERYEALFERWQKRHPASAAAQE